MADPTRISATAPPTIANLAVGFDMLGLAIKGVGDIVHVEAGERPGVHISSISGDGGRLSKVAEENTATAGIISMLQALGRKESLNVILEKRMPLGSGMGSSASSAAAGVMSANAYLGNPFSKEELVEHALIGESVASGAIHGDNVVPSLLGGHILMRRNEPADVLQLPFIDELVILIIHPHVEVMTSESRGRLKRELSLQQHIIQSADTSAYIHAMHTGDIDLLKRSLRDHIIGPQRKKDIPLFDKARESALDCGGLNYDISGSGPSTFGFFTSVDEAHQAGEEISLLLAPELLDCDIEVTRIDHEGARII